MYGDRRKLPNPLKYNRGMLRRVAAPLKQPRLQELADIVRRYTEFNSGTNAYQTAIEGLAILRADHTKLPEHRIFKPALCITVQGAKRAAFGEKWYDYTAGQALLISVDLPSRGTVSAASPQNPFLGIVIELDLAVMQQTVANLRLKPNLDEPIRLASVMEVDNQLLDCILRVIHLLAAPEAITTLYPGFMREICYYLLVGPCRDQMIQATMTDEHEGGIVKALNDLRARFSKPIRIKELAMKACMSPATFYRHFKSTTSMTPIQYQKQLRLLEARRLMIDNNVNVDTAATKVGYESSSQFSREYSRMFGQSPKRDTSSLQVARDP